MHQHQFEGVAEFREVLPQLARASNHNVFIDIDEEYDSTDISAPGNPGQPIQVPRQAVWNNRDNELAYIGSDNYEITQHTDLLGYIDDAVGQTVGEIDIGYIRDYGERIDGMVTLEGHSIDVGELVGEGYVPPDSAMLSDRTASVDDAMADDDGWVRDILGVGLRFNNSFDASERIRLETMGYRYVCQNWMVWGEETIGTYEQLHLEELHQENVEELIFEVLDQQEQIEGIIVDANDQWIKPSWVQPALEEAGFGGQYQKRIMKELEGYDTNDDGEYSRWAVYNAATYVLDHYTVERVNPNVYDRHQGRAINVLMNEISSPSEEVEFEEVIA